MPSEAALEGVVGEVSPVGLASRSGRFVARFTFRERCRLTFPRTTNLVEQSSQLDDARIAGCQRSAAGDDLSDPVREVGVGVLQGVGGGKGLGGG